jgi:glycosyltransferase involved in cell wall biosynthesis
VKVLFFVQGLTVAASRYRVLHYIPFLNDAGIDSEVVDFPANTRSWAAVWPTIKSADILFVQRKRLPLHILVLLANLKKKIIYDFDDAVMFKNSLVENPYSLRRRMSFKRMLRFTDLVIAGNAFLAAEAQKYHKTVRILPTPVDAARYTSKSYYKKDIVTIGWIGDHGSIHYMESYKDVWEALGEKYPHVELAIICDTFIETTRIKVRRIQWSYDTEIASLQSLDIGVMPLFDDLWSKGKCGYKIIQYLGVGVPAVCTPVGINKDVVRDGKCGLWATSKEEWVEKLSFLIENDAVRQSMGLAGRKVIMEGYTVQACAPLLMDWIRTLV